MKKKYLVILLVILGINSLPLKAQNAKFQALFIYNFSKNIEWPAGYLSSEFVIGILGSASSIENELRQIALVKTVRNKPIKIITFPAVQNITDCNILYIPRSRSSMLERTLVAVQNKPILIVTDKSGLRGAGINFLDNDFDLEFEINLTDLQKRGLKADKTLIDLGIKI